MITFNPEIGMQKYVDDQLVQFGFKYDDNLKTIDNLKNIFSLQRRIPTEKRRLVVELPEINISKETEKAYDAIKKKLTLGLTIKPHLSFSAKKYIYKDLLLNSWNILHLHLSEEPFKDGFFKRTGPVLFCMFFDNVVIFIDIMNHGVGFSDIWVNENLIKKLHKYFPELIERYKVKGITGNDFDSKQRLALRNSHCNFAMKMEDGTVYQLMGLMTNGDSFIDTHKIMRIQVTIDYFEKVIKNDGKAIKHSLEVKESESLALTITFIENEIKLYCPDKKTIINIKEPV